MKILRITILVFTSVLCNAQNISVIYKEKKILSQEKLNSLPVLLKEKEMMDMENPPGYVLSYSNGISLYINDIKTKNTDNSIETKTEVQNADGIEQKTFTNRITDKTKEKTYYKNFKNNELLFKLTNSGRDYNGKDSLLNWNWEISSETKNINGYQCKKAKTYAYGMDFTAWFTEDIPINAGPEKFDGLPGLILYVGNQYIEFIAESISFHKEPIIIQKPALLSNTFTMLKMYEDARKNMPKSGTTTTTEGSKTTTTTKQVYH